MKYIDKDYASSVVQTHKTELQANSLDETSLLNPTIRPGQTGSKLWKLVRDIKVIPHFWDLKHQMMSEQGGICCYCGLKINFGSERKATVEHLKPKGVFRELVGEYKNLLLSCSLTQDEEADIASGVRPCLDVSHCDDTKENNILNYTPLQSDCDEHFVYDMFGHIHETDTYSKTDIDTLNLDCKALVDRRKAAMDVLFDEQGNIISNDELQTLSNTIMDRQSDGNFREFCFVIKSVVDDLLNRNTLNP